MSHVNTLIKQLPNRVAHSDHGCIQSAQCVNVLLILTHVYITHILTDDTDSFVSLSYAHYREGRRRRITHHITEIILLTPDMLD